MDFKIITMLIERQYEVRFAKHKNPYFACLTEDITKRNKINL